MVLMALPLPPRLPGTQLTPPEGGGDELQQEELLEQLHRFAEGVFKENVSGLRYSSWYVRTSFWVLLTMYVALFLVGIVTAVFAVVKGFQANTGGEAIGALSIGGLSAASFFSLFLTRPLESLERNSFYMAWLTAIQNTYWTRLMYFSDLEKIDDELEDATEDLVKHLTTLADKHAAATGKYPALVGRESSETSGGKKASKEKGPAG
jgi:hypothetical protein